MGLAVALELLFHQPVVGSSLLLPWHLLSAKCTEEKPSASCSVLCLAEMRGCKTHPELCSGASASGGGGGGQRRGGDGDSPSPPGPRGAAVSLGPCPCVLPWSPACSDDAVAPPGRCSPSFVPEPYFSPRHQSAVEKLCLSDTTSCGSPGLFVSFLVCSVSCWASGFLFPARPALEGLGTSDMCRMSNAGASGLSLGWTDGHRAGWTDAGLEAV